MYVSSVSLQSFRNYENLEFSPHHHTNLLIGGNAQGKSSILEALYLLSTSRSYRPATDEELIRVRSTYARIMAAVDRSTRPNVLLEMIISRNKRRLVRVDKKERRKLTEFIGQLNTVVFSAFDVEMVRGEPALRRRFLDIELSQISSHYLHALVQYKRALEHRNHALRSVREGQVDQKVLDALDRQLVLYGSEVIRKRIDFVSSLASEAQKIYNQISSGEEVLLISYKTSALTEELEQEELADRLADLLLEKRDADIARGITTVGPHRDDVYMTINGLSVRNYASQGQHRSVAIALKLAQANIFRTSLGEPPVMLLDDVSADLDQQRRSQVLSFVANGFQSFVTATSIADLPIDVLREYAVFEVKGGSIRRL